MAELNLTPEEIRGLSPEVRKKLGVSNPETFETLTPKNSAETGKIMAENLTLETGGTQPVGVLPEEVKKKILNMPEGSVDPAIRDATDPKEKMNYLLHKLQNGGVNPHELTDFVTKQ